MLQRAASNAYSWWWASHIRAKQGKWLDQNLQDMEEKVKSILSVIEDDADSFTKRAAMFYKKRPELIEFVEEYHEAFKSLVERYCHIAKDLQNANNTIATAFPNQVQFSMEDDDDDEALPKASSLDSSKIPKEFPGNPKLNLEFVVKTKDTDTPSPLQPEKSEAETVGLQKEKVEVSPEEFDKLQKEIMTLQTEMESVKNSYENGLAKYWEIEERITGMQENVCNLQEEFSISTFIEDNEARSLVAVTALKSCEDTLIQLQEQHKRSVEEARMESKKVKDMEKKLKILLNEFLQTENPKVSNEAEVNNSTNKNSEEEVCSPKQEKLEFQFIHEKVKEYFEMNYNTPLTVTDLAEKIDEFVNMILDLQTMASSQNALIKRLRLDADELQNHLLGLEQDKMNLTGDSTGLNEKRRELENELHAIQNLNDSLKDQNKLLQMGFTDVCHNLDDLSEKLQSGEKKDEAEIMDMEESDYLSDVSTEESQEQEVMTSLVNDSRDLKDEIMESDKETKGTKDHGLCVEDQENHIQLKQHVRVRSRTRSNLDALSAYLQEPKNQDEVENRLPSEGEDSALLDTINSPNWKQLLSRGSEEQKKIILEEYTSVLRNYKETKKRLFEAERENKDTFLETMTLVKQLKSVNALKEMEIRSLRQKLSILETSPDENSHHGMVGRMEDVSKSSTDNVQEKSLDGSNSNALENLVKENSDSLQRTDESNAAASSKTPTKEEAANLTVEPYVASSIEEKFRKDIDELLEENLQFWLRFSTSSQQLQKFHNETEDVHAQCSKLCSSSSDPSAKPEAAPIIKRLNELRTELLEWLEENASLEEELQSRNSALSKIQEEISRASMMCYETEQVEFTTYEATKFQGEVLNMQQENSKVECDLQTGLDHVRGLQLEVEKVLSMLQGSSRVSGSKSHKATSPNRVSLESFIYGKQKKHSKFSFMNPALQKQFRDLKAQLPK